MAGVEKKPSPKFDLKASLLEDSPKTKKSPMRMTMATTASAASAVAMRNRRASVQKADMRNKRASVATSDARMMEERRDEAMEQEFLEMCKRNKAIEKGLNKNAGTVLKKIGRRASVMAGMKVEEETEEEKEGEGQTNPEAVLNMLNNGMGTGMLALAAVMMKVGIVVGVSVMAFSAALNCYTLLVHVNTCRLAGCDPAGATIGEIAIGKKGALIMTIAYVLICFFAMTSYVDASADAMKTVAALFFPAINDINETLFKICNWAIMLVPGTFIRELSGVATLSLISFIGALLVLFAVVVRCGGGLLQKGMPSAAEINWFPESVDKLLGAAPVLILCYALQAGGGVIVGTLKDNSPANQRNISMFSFGFIFILELTVALSAYLFFLDATAPDVMNAFPATDTIANLGRLGVLFMVVCGYVMLNVPTRVMIIQLLFNKNEAAQEASYSQFMSVNLAISGACLATGLAITDLSVVLGFCGAIPTPMVAFILPALFTIFVRAKSDDPEVETPLISGKQSDMYSVLCLGTVLWIVFIFQLGLSLGGYTVTNDFKIEKAA